jgi:NAD+ kinase
MSRTAGSQSPRVLLIYKKSAYQIYVRERHNARIKRLIATGDESVARLMRAHEHHMEALVEARAALADLGARASFRHRSHPGHAQEFDLVVTLGGDGTLLWASRLVGPEVPIVAINTAPEDSVGYFCAGKKGEIREVLGAALRGELRVAPLSRMRVDIDGELVTKRVLNDVLFCHECPASTSRYTLQLGRRQEEQKSSGIWVGPAAGSTAGQHSAGGRILPMRSKHLQFVVREPYYPRREGYRMLKGLVPAGAILRIESRMRSARVYLDGPHDHRDIEMASCIELRLSDEPLMLLGFRGEGRRRRG